MSDREQWVEAVAGAWRPRDARGDLTAHPGWHDLDAAAREEAFEVALVLRQLEAALDPEGLSTTGKSVLAAIRRAAR